MSVKVRNLAMFAAGLLLAACFAGGGGADKTKTGGVNPITGGDISVTALDAPAVQSGVTAEAADQPAPMVAPAVQPGPEAKSEAKAEPTPVTKPDPATAKASETPEVAPPEAAPLLPEELKTAAQKACEKKGNRWVKAGKSGASACVQGMKDAGKRCVNGTQCQGECLARSMTCSPYKPLFGCNEILQDNGVRMTLCID